MDQASKTAKKIALQQKIIKSLSEQNEALRIENQTLRDELELEMAKPQEGFEQAKLLMEEMEYYKKEYEEAIACLRESKEEYNNAKKQLNEIEVSMKKKMGGVLKTFSKKCKAK